MARFGLSHNSSFCLTCSGHVPSAKFYTQVLLLVLFIGLATAVKRVVVGFLQGKRVFSIYGDEVAALMRKVLLVSQVGALARDIESKAMRISHHNHSHKTLRKKREAEKFVPVWDNTDQGGMMNSRLTDNVAEDSERFSSSQKLQIMELLGEFEDPSFSTGDGRMEIEVSRNMSSF